ncbi:MAG: GntR family transcriptional regulator [Methylibium sp.]|uniref:GntR family transcriptional regulator n=1 Tax=Methylibium sp. TaxID=2067992 RepID=UPI0017EB5266|nr:GntR family transcriptional regulator [Methylibium sp.]MBA3589489.1 GntR family transcriptional regulator [Methylibium sp.]MBA3624774.1 GntR family transcriptional regulator [Methylibium sp.]
MAANPPSPPTAQASSGTAAGPAFSPLYQQIKALITRSLQTSEWRPGEAIPSETELAVRYRVSQGTVRKAIDELAAENLVLRRQGKGTFVATHAEQQVQYRFLRLVPDTPAKREPVERRLLDCRRVRANAEVARTLDLKAGDPVIQARRLLVFAGRPVVLDDIWLPGSLFKGLTTERLADYRGPLYAFFEAEFGVRTLRAEEKLRATAANAVDASLLAVAEGAPLLSVERRTLTYGDKPVELRRGLYETSNHYYRNELN